MNQINKPAFHVIVTLPLVVLAFLGVFTSQNGFAWHYLGYALFAYYLNQIVVCVGLHRLWAHNAFKAHPAVEWVLSWLAAGTLQGPILAWASDHHRHHTYTDTTKDPHTPLKYESATAGFIWSHLGWMLWEPTPKHIERVTLVKLGRSKPVMWQLKHYWPLAIFMNVVPPLLIGFLVEQSLTGALAALLYMNLGRVLQQQATFTVNSLCHFFGRRPYTAGTARDVWWLALVLLGENWHNFHHAFPKDYRNGHKWYHLDVHKWIINGLKAVGLAWDLEETPELRIAAKTQMTETFLSEKYLKLLEAMEKEYKELRAELISQYDSFKANLPATQLKLRRKYVRLLLRSEKMLKRIQILRTKDNPKRFGLYVRKLRKKLLRSERKLQKLFVRKAAISS